jgi:tight adherence protein B
MLLAALSAGACASLAALWVTGFAGGSSSAAARLAQLRANDSGLDTATLSLRRQAGVRFGRFNIISARGVAGWRIQLERAGLTLTPKEYFVVRVAVGAILALVMMVVLNLLPVALVAVPVGYLGVGFWVKMRITKRTRLLESQLPETLSMVASGLKAGFGFIQAIEGTTEQMRPPISVEVRRMLRDIAVGASVEQALQALNDRVGSSDFDIAITAIMIQRNVGGNLAEILENVAHTMRERDRIRGEIRTLTAQQRLTGFVLGGTPIALGAVLFMMNPDFMKLLFTESLGRMLLGGAMVLETIGFFVIKKIVDIEV